MQGKVQPGIWQFLLYFLSKAELSVDQFFVSNILSVSVSFLWVIIYSFITDTQLYKFSPFFELQPFVPLHVRAFQVSSAARSVTLLPLTVHFSSLITISSSIFIIY